MIVNGVEVVSTDGKPVRDPAELEVEAEYIRARSAPKPIPGQIKTPDDIIEDIEWAKHLAGRGVLIEKECDRTLRALQRLYAREFSKASKRSGAKSSEERKAEADTELAELVLAVDEAEVVYSFAKRVARVVELSASGTQSQGGLVKVTYGLAGSGREG